MNKEMQSLLEMQKSLEDTISQFGGTNALIDLTQDILPKDKFMAEIDGVHVEVSSGLSGKAIVLLFSDPKDQAKVFAELKENKKGFFKRIFNVK